MTATILLVEDDLDTSRLLRDLLGKRKYRVEAVQSGPECLAWLRDHSADAVIADVQMPGMDGLELCRQLQREWPELPVIVLTAQANLDTADAAISAGACDLVTKPMRLETLTVAVERAFQRSVHVR